MGFNCHIVFKGICAFVPNKAWANGPTKCVWSLCTADRV